MRNILKKSSLLGAVFYLVTTPFQILSQMDILQEDALVDLIATFVFAFIAVTSFILLIVYNIQILRKKEPLFLIWIEQKYPIASSYLTAIGWIAYADLVTGLIVGLIYLNNNDVKMLVKSLLYLDVVFFVLAIICLLTQSVILYKNRNKKEGRILSAYRKLCKEGKKDD